MVDVWGAAAAASVGSSIGQRSREPVLLDAGVADELCAAATNALDNFAFTRRWQNAHAYVLLEDLGDSVTVSIRDDGVGIAEGLTRGSGRGRPRRSG